MKNVKLAVIATTLAGVLGAEPASAQPSRQPSRNPSGQPTQTTTPGPQRPAGMSLTATTPEEALRDIEQTLGFVPQWMRAVPDHLLVGFWDSFKGLELNPATQLDSKTKELIGLAVAAQIPCEYCVYFHTSAARRNGATDQEIKEALGMAAVTRMASTILNGSQIDKTAFRKETDRMIKGEPGRAARQGSMPQR